MNGKETDTRKILADEEEVLSILRELAKTTILIDDDESLYGEVSEDLVIRAKKALRRGGGGGFSAG